MTQAELKELKDSKQLTAKVVVSLDIERDSNIVTITLSQAMRHILNTFAIPLAEGDTEYKTRTINRGDLVNTNAKRRLIKRLFYSRVERVSTSLSRDSINYLFGELYPAVEELPITIVLYSYPDEDKRLAEYCRGLFQVAVDLIAEMNVNITYIIE